MNNKTIIFDLDGTVADTLPGNIKIANSLAKRFGFRKIEDEDYARLRDMSSSEIIKDLNIPTWKLPIIMWFGRRALNSSIFEIAPISGMDEILQILTDRGYRLGILTVNSEAHARAFVSQNNLENFFEFVRSRYGFLKKHRALKNLIKEYDLDPENTYHVGDESSDAVAAHNVGIKSVAVTWGLNSRKAMEDVSADYIIDSPDELLEVFK